MPVANRVLGLDATQVGADTTADVQDDVVFPQVEYAQRVSGRGPALVLHPSTNADGSADASTLSKSPTCTALTAGPPKWALPSAIVTCCQHPISGAATRGVPRSVQDLTVDPTHISMQAELRRRQVHASESSAPD